MRIRTAHQVDAVPHASTEKMKMMTKKKKLKDICNARLLEGMWVMVHTHYRTRPRGSR